MPNVRPPIRLSLALILLPLSVCAQRRLLDQHRAMLPYDPQGSVSASLGDVDGDGAPDLFVTRSATSGPLSVQLYRNEGDGKMLDVTTAWLPTTALYSGSGSVTLGDVDGDGDLDAFLSGSGNGPTLIINQGAAGFADETLARWPSFPANARIALGDVDGDGDLDAVAAHWFSRLGSRRNRLYLNDGTGRFADVTATALPFDDDGSTAVVLEDIDLDGDLDIVFGNTGSPSAQTRVYRNEGANVFVDITTSVMPVDSDDTFGLVFGDVDGDGDRDLLVGNVFPANRLYLKQAGGVFVDATAAWLPPTTNTRSIAMADIDGDQELDVVVGRLGQQNLLYLNEGASFRDATATHMPAVDDTTTNVVVGDVDGDLDVDVVSINGQGRDRLLLNDGEGRLADVTRADPPPAGFTGGVALGDLDGDGDLDALLGNDARLWANDGSGQWSDATARLPSGGLGPFALGDLDGDGDLDVFSPVPWINNAGVFSIGSPLPPGFFNHPVLGDVDGDGDLDALVGTGFPGYASDRLLLNDGSATFVDVTSTHMPSRMELTRAAFLVDVDQDGDLDAVLGTDGQDRLYRNDGRGRFVDDTAASMPPSIGATAAIAAIDLEGDGDLDLVAGGGSLNANYLYRNDGTGRFADASTELPDRFGALAVAVVDLDRDGELDLLLGTPQQPRVFLKDGSGALVDASSWAVPLGNNFTSSIAVGDLDGDGDPDAYLNNVSGQDTVWMGQHRQLAWSTFPRIGQRLQLQVRGPSASPWWLFLAGSRAEQPTAVGTWWLGLDLALAATGSLDAQGAAATEVFVPHNPSLVGLSVHWQALFGSPLSLSNLEISTFTVL
ncbi:MAG: VCBS repeat-containing protein [Planctomycetota bacterium]